MAGPAEGGRQAPRARRYHHRSRPVHPGEPPKKSSCSRPEHGSVLSRERKEGLLPQKKVAQEQLKSCSYDFILQWSGWALLLRWPLAKLTLRACSTRSGSGSRLRVNPTRRHGQETTRATRSKNFVPVLQRDVCCGLLACEKGVGQGWVARPFFFQGGVSTYPLFPSSCCLPDLYKSPFFSMFCCLINNNTARRRSTSTHCRHRQLTRRQHDVRCPHPLGSPRHHRRPRGGLRHRRISVAFCRRCRRGPSERLPLRACSAQQLSRSCHQP